MRFESLRLWFIDRTRACFLALLTVPLSSVPPDFLIVTLPMMTRNGPTVIHAMSKLDISEPAAAQLTASFLLITISRILYSTYELSQIEGPT